MKPYLFLDVDDVLNAKVMPYQEHLVEIDTADLPTNPFVSSFTQPTITFRVAIHNPIPDWLAELAEVYELVWATTWEHLANTHISPLVGLGDIPVVELSATQGTKSEIAQLLAASWKWRAITDFADDHPFVFVDDRALDQARIFPLEPADGSVPTQAALWVEYGLTRDHVDQLLAHAERLAAQEEDAAG